MTFYMVRNKKTGRWYKRWSEYGFGWTRREAAAIWTTLDGPHACMETLARYIKQRMCASCEIEIVALSSGDLIEAQ